MNHFGQEKKMNGLNNFIGQLIFLPVILLEGFLEVFLILLGWLETGDLFKYL